MFQKFDAIADPSSGRKRLAALRKEMRRKKLDHYLVPHADEHQNEYLPERAERLKWLTGFSGSAGFAIISLKQAVVFVDSRYTLQMQEQVDQKSFKGANLIDTPPTAWISKNAKKKSRIGFDPWLLTIGQRERFAKSAKEAGARLIACPNLIDRIWQDQPATPLGRVNVHDIAQAGKSAAEKIKELQKAIAEKGCDQCLLTDPASLCWLLNIRGTDLAHNPLALGYAVVPAKGRPHLFIDKRKLTDETGAYLTKLIKLHPPASLKASLAKWARRKSVLCDPDLVASKLADIITKAGGKIVRGRDPVILPRAIKNTVEIEGCRTAHHRDGVAVCRFLSWLDAQIPGTVDEIGAAKQLEQFRSSTAKNMGSELKELSFDTISGAGSNGAVVHYRVNEKTNKALDDGTLYLNDSGGQYVDGTTDITRTIAVGTPPKQAVEDFTLVLKGHIGVALARFPKGTRGVDLDVLARKALWSKGKDYGHGTGHGVGSYLNVHEGPQSISRRGMEPLLPGMIISNEPGYYLEGSHGIRIENLVLVTEAETPQGGTTPMHAFETLTLAPIDLRLIDAKLLTGGERDWLNAYHARVRRELSPHVGNDTKKWLATATKSV